MNRKQFLILLAVLVVLAAAGAGVLVSDRSAWKSADSRIGQRLVPGLRISDVAGIAIRDASGELHLAKGEGGWTVRERAGFAADTGRIGELLLKLAELKIVQDESLPESQRTRLQLVEPKDGTTPGAGTLLELKDAKGATLARLLLGRKVMKNAEAASPGGDAGEATGRYLVAANDARTMLVVSEPFSQVEAKPDEWLIKDLIRAERVKSIASIGGDGRQRWRVTRDNDSADWKFAGSKEKPDLQKATDLASSLGWVNLVDVVADPAKADTGLERAVAIKADTFDGLAYTLRIGNKAGDNYYVGIAAAGEPLKARTPEKGEKAGDKANKDKEFDERRKKLEEQLGREKQLGRWTYLVAKSGIEPLLRERAQLLPEKKKDAKETAKKI
ncbi:MAG: DUF4340 domain-containing protein [Burkholderiales bacterium]